MHVSYATNIFFLFIQKKKKMLKLYREVLAVINKML